jgi:hypothetical protein
MIISGPGIEWDFVYSLLLHLIDLSFVISLIFSFSNEAKATTTSQL